MSTITIPIDDNYSVKEYKINQLSTTYECQGLFVLEDDNRYSAHCLNLPGVHSQGDSLKEAICNLDEAFEGAVRSYVNRSLDIPWRDMRGHYCEEAGEERRTAVYV